MRLAVIMTLQFYINMVKGLKLNDQKFLGQISTFVEVTGEKLIEAGRGGLFSHHPIPPSWIVLKEIDFL